MIEKMKAKLQRLEQEFDVIFDDNPRAGHGGTPNITDNCKGRQMIRICEKRDERLRNKRAAIEAQQEKIRVAEDREAYRQTQTKKSKKFVEKNPIHPALLALTTQGRLNQWARNPEYFFVPGANKVALKTIGGRVMISARFPLTRSDDVEIVRAIMTEVKSISDHIAAS